MTTCKALIVDDSATARFVLARMLRQLEVNILQASSGEAALSLLQTEIPDIVFLDHIMPGLDGFQVLKSMKSNPSTAFIPVVMYTSQSALKYKNEAKALGALGVISKQPELDTVHAIIERITEDKRAHAETVIDLSSRQPPHSFKQGSSASTPERESAKLSEDQLIQLLSDHQAAIQQALSAHNAPAPTWRRWSLRVAVLGLFLLPAFLISNLSEQLAQQSTLIAQLQNRLNEQDQKQEISTAHLTRKLASLASAQYELQDNTTLMNEFLITLSEQVAEQTENASLLAVAPTQETLRPITDAENTGLANTEIESSTLESTSAE